MIDFTKRPKKISGIYIPVELLEHFIDVDSNVLDNLNVPVKVIGYMVNTHWEPSSEYCIKNLVKLIKKECPELEPLLKRKSTSYEKELYGRFQIFINSNRYYNGYARDGSDAELLKIIKTCISKSGTDVDLHCNEPGRSGGLPVLVYPLHLTHFGKYISNVFAKDFIDEFCNFYEVKKESLV